MGAQGSFGTLFQPMFDPVSVHCGAPSSYQGLSYTSISFPSHHDRLHPPEPSSNSPKPRCNDIHQARDQPRPPSSQTSRQVLPRECSLCDQSFTSNRDLNRHLWSKHPTYAAATDVPSQQSSCPIRDCTYTGRRDNVLRHIRLKHSSNE
ncbi:hypothetical protein GGR58DRAFT_118137 [Xylaria digitata]|nr:hypothetical protein GGR58DRAFT_118137 [Xylaria digitata]